MFRIGDFVEIDGLLAVVIATAEDGKSPEGHLSVWFGDQQGMRSSQGGAGGSIPEVWIVPTEHCQAASTVLIRH